MSWLKDIIEAKLNRWHTYVHTHYDSMKIVEANKRIVELSDQNLSLKKEVERLKLQLEIKQMNNFLEGR